MLVIPKEQQLMIKVQLLMKMFQLIKVRKYGTFLTFNLTQLLAKIVQLDKMSTLVTTLKLVTLLKFKIMYQFMKELNLKIMYFVVLQWFLQM